MNSRETDFPRRVCAELKRARESHAELRSDHEAFAVILEEVEEYKREVFRKRKDRNRRAMLTELVQIAAMAQRAAEDLDHPLMDLDLPY